MWKVSRKGQFLSKSLWLVNLKLMNEASEVHNTITMLILDPEDAFDTISLL